MGPRPQISPISPAVQSSPFSRKIFMSIKGGAAPTDPTLRSASSRSKCEKKPSVTPYNS